MSYRNSFILILGLGLLSCKQDPGKQPDREMVIYDRLMEAEMLIDYISREDMVIVDFRQPDLYSLEHIPGALNIWRTDLENKNYPYSGMKPEKKELEAILGAKGIHSRDHIVVYDEKGSVDASRFWWLLKYYNFDSVSILNGGLSAWKEAGGLTSTAIPQIKNTSFKLPGSTRHEMLVTKEQLASWLDSDSLAVTILDVRSSEEYTGKSMKTGAYRAGRIPASKHLEWNLAVDQDNSNRFRSVSELKKIFLDNEVYLSDTIVVYCHSGSRSAHSAFVLEELLKYDRVKNYDGSWTEWSYYSSLPIESDSLVALKQ